MELGHNKPKKKRCIYVWEMALGLGLLCSVLWTQWLNQEQSALAEGMIRLHVVAHSDSPDDQDLKLVVRDKILETAETLFQEGMNPQEAEAFFQEHRALLEEAGESVAEGYAVQAELGDVWFPTKEYEGFALPSGEYRALNIIIGEGEGENWWCVAYPPLCLGAVSETMEQAVEAGNFTSQQVAFMEGDGYVLKFKSMELWENWKKKFS